MGKIPFFWSVREKLLLLLIVAFLPALAIVINSGLDYRRKAIERAGVDARLLVSSLAAQQEQIAIGTRGMLVTLARLPQVQQLEADACNELFRDLKNRYPFYSTISLVMPDGNLFASSSVFKPGGVNVLRQRHIQEAIRSRDFSAGEYIVGVITRIPTIHYSYPVTDDNGNLIAVLVAGFKLEEYDRFLSEIKLPEDSVVTVADHRGVRLYRLPQSGATPLGQVIPESRFKALTGDSNEGVYESPGGDGENRIYAYKSLYLAKQSAPYLYILVGMAKEPIIGEANREMLHNSLLMGTTALLMIFLAWIFGRMMLVKPVDRLVTATRRLAMGDLSSRTGLPHTADELGLLAKSFDDMVSRLEVNSVEQKKAEQALRESEARLQSVLDYAPVLVFMKDLQGRYILINRRCEQVLGLKNEEVRGKKMHEILSGEMADQFAADDSAVVESGKAHEFEEVIRDEHGGAGTFLSVQFPLFNETGAIYAVCGISTDITDRKRAEEELKAYTAKLEQLNKELEEFAWIASHDLKEPLRKIQAFGSRLERMRDSLSPECRDDLQRIIQSASRMASLIDALKSYSGITGRADPFEPADLSVVVWEAVSSLETAVEEAGGRIEVSELPSVEVDRVRMRQLFENLIANAVKYARKNEKPVVRIAGREVDGICRICVEDNGIGFEEQYVDRIFVPFQRLHGRNSPYEGTGMGLAICRKVAELHGGTITARSTPEEGSTFIVTLPVKQPES